MDTNPRTRVLALLDQRQREPDRVETYHRVWGDRILNDLRYIPGPARDVRAAVMMTPGVIDCVVVRGEKPGKVYIGIYVTNLPVVEKVVLSATWWCPVTLRPTLVVKVEGEP